MPTATFLGDVYLSIADRTLARGGIEVVRWVDDYRLTATSLQDAYRVKTDLEIALRDLGLVIGSAKTYIVARKELATRIGARKKREKELDAVRVRIQKRVRDEYEASQGDDQIEPTTRKRPSPDAALEAGFTRAAHDDAPTDAGEEALAASRQIQLSLRELGRTGSAAPLKRLEHLLYRHPHSTKHMATYLRQRIRAGFERDTIAVISKVLAAEDFPYPWQRGWLFHSLVPANGPIPKAAKDAAAEAFNSIAEMSFVRGRAAVLLATERLLPLGSELGAAYESVKPASRGDVVVAATLMPPSPDRERFLASARREPLNREIERNTLEAEDAFIL
jgi:Sec-independent protein translocase protein TatA